MKTNYSSLLAYIDPGTGSFLLQMLIAGIVGAVAYFRKAVFGLFHRNKANEPDAEGPHSSSSAPDHKPGETPAATVNRSGQEAGGEQSLK
jgi:hypothetical protein